MSRKMLRVFVVLVLATLTLAGSAQAAGLGARSVEAPGLAVIWESIAGWLRTVRVPGPSALWGNEGPSMDPNGLTPTGPTDSTNPADGRSMDPDGR